jgi:hypothetical protein
MVVFAVVPWAFRHSSEATFSSSHPRKSHQRQVAGYGVFGEKPQEVFAAATLKRRRRKDPPWSSWKR